MKLAILATGGINLDVLLNLKRIAVDHLISTNHNTNNQSTILPRLLHEKKIPKCTAQTLMGVEKSVRNGCWDTLL